MVKRGAIMRTGSYESSDKSTAGTAVTFLLIGLGAGALVALLLAPKTGKQLRRDIRRKYDDAREIVEDFADEARERVNDVMERGSEFVETARERMEPLSRAMRNR
jgi:gas vesicle protein